MEKKGRKLRRRLGVGADGGRNEHIRAVLSVHGDVDADATGGLLSQFASEWAGGVLPRWYYAHSLASRLVALEKKKVGRRELKPVRPIGVGSAVHRLICSAVVEHAKSVFLRLLAPIQVAVNVEAAAEKLHRESIRLRRELADVDRAARTVACRLRAARARAKEQARREAVGQQAHQASARWAKSAAGEWVRVQPGRITSQSSIESHDLSAQRQEEEQQAYKEAEEKRRASGKWRYARCTHSAEPSIIDIISPR